MALSQECDVFIIEDDYDIRDILTEVLKDEGYGVAGASNGREAIQSLSNCWHGRQPKLILLDLMMPIMTGWQFVCEQRKNRTLANIPVIVVSADRNLQQKADSMGASGHLRKPIEIEALLTLVKRYCGLR